jgi:hypothetical protein
MKLDALERAELILYLTKKIIIIYHLSPLLCYERSHNFRGFSQHSPGIREYSVILSINTSTGASRQRNCQNYLFKLITLKMKAKRIIMFHTLKCAVEYIVSYLPSFFLRQCGRLLHLIGCCATQAAYHPWAISN